MVELLAQAAGSRGMVGGQAVDLASEQVQLTLAELEALHIHKTDAMIRVCMQLACAAADGLAVAQCEALDHYAKAIGLAFQIGRAHVCTPVTNQHLVCRLLLAKNTNT